MDGGWATGGQKFKRRILDISVYTDPFSFTSTGMYEDIFKQHFCLSASILMFL